MKKQKEKKRFKMKKNQEKGITLIALVITIIVLLILAGVTIATLTGDNGILTRAIDAKEQTEIGEEKEKVELSAIGALAKDNGGEIKRNYLNDELTSYIGTEGTDYTLSESETAPFVVTYLDSGRSYLIDENGNISEYVDIAEYVKVGDYVDYNPTVLDKSGTPVEENKLTYTSQTGSGTKPGNGYTSTEENGGQTFTATASIKWRVLDIGNGTVTLISEEPVKKDDASNSSGDFVMKGAIGYLYAERELNEICKIYGYGYGADTSQITEYSYGGPLDGGLTGKITGSGARSITVEDINKQAGIDTIEDYKEIDSNYGSTEYPSTDILYPTITTLDGKSELKGTRNLEYTYYSYNNSKIENKKIHDMLFNANYWLAARCIKTNYYNPSSFNVRLVNRVGMDAYYLCYGYGGMMTDDTGSGFAVRPVITLKSNVIDTNTNYKAEGHWNLK